MKNHLGDGYRRIDGVLDLIASVQFDMERFAGLQRNESRLISLAMNSRFFLSAMSFGRSQSFLLNFTLPLYTAYFSCNFLTLPERSTVSLGQFSNENSTSKLESDFAILCIVRLNF